VILQELKTESVRHMKSLNLSKRTTDEYEIKLNCFLRWLESTCFILVPEALKPAHLESYQHHLAEYLKPDGMPYTKGTINQYVWAVKTFMGYLKKHHHTGLNLAESIIHIKEPDLLPTAVFDHKQMQKFINAIDTSTPIGIRDRAIVELMYSSGCRVTEITTINMDTLFLNDQTAKVLGKGAKERLIVFTSKTKRHLETYIRSTRPFLKGADACPALFLGNRGERLRSSGIQHRFKQYRKLAGLDKMTPHAVRRSVTTTLVKENKMSLPFLKELLGHADYRTLDRYARLNHHDLLKALEKHHPRERDRS
jgi:site-specific recombinase XerD